jgi:UDP-glucose 4-epimerase
MRTLVTGGAGFIGSNLVDRLLGQGEEVTVLDDLSTGRRVNLAPALEAGAELVEGDVRDAACVGSLFERARPETIFHLAAQIDVRKSVADPAFDASINVGGTATLLEAARVAETSRVVFISTGGAIYGEGEGKSLPLDEGAAVEPLSPYGQSKFAGEGYLALYERLYGLSGVSLRLGNVYGPRQDPLGEAGVIAIFCGRLRGGRPPVVFGDGRQTRDYIYVGDVVSAALAAAAAEATGAFNVGTGVETTVLDLVESLRRLSGESGFEPQLAPPRPGEVQRISIDPSQAAGALGWRPQVDLDQGLRLTLDSL